MTPTVDLSGLKRAHWLQFVLRFVLGGAVTACTGLVAQHWGPLIGGLFLAFPAIFPASATLIAQHEREKKRRAGMECRRRGRKAAALEAAGAVLGGYGLIAFALVVWLALPRFAVSWTLAFAGAAWLAVAVSLWWVRERG
jgi:MFS family permease